MKRWLILLALIFRLDAVSANTPMNTGDGVIEAMRHFNPSSVLEGYTATPSESAVNPSNELEQKFLEQQGKLRIKEDKTASFVLEQEQKRAKISPNPKSPEIEEGARLIIAAENSVNPSCHMEPVPCEERSFEKTCEERIHFLEKHCERQLDVKLNRINHVEVRRTLAKNLTTINLTSCDDSSSVLCTPKQLIHLNPRCEYIEVQVLLNNRSLQLIKLPTCSDPTLTISNELIPDIFKAKIYVVEYWSESDAWQGGECKAASDASCIPQFENECQDANQTKIIQGIPVTRKCWGEDKTFQCANETITNCEPLLDAGCSNTAAHCVSFQGTRCDVTEKTFQCTERRCFPDKEVCSEEALFCVDGSCDNTKDEASDDINEGISRLGTLTGTAEEVSKNQVQSGQPAIFKGEAQECESYPLGFRDCCKDSGFLDGLIHCPSDMQSLQRAKVDGRVMPLGHYRHHFYNTTRYVYCVFPTKLAAIIQIQGRFNQLKIPFGIAEHPDCRGIVPEELERINFEILDIRAVVNDFVNKKSFPNDANANTANEGHVDALYQKGAAHD